MGVVFRVGVVAEIVYVAHVEDRDLVVVLGEERYEGICVGILEDEDLLVALKIRFYLYARLIGAEVDAVLVLYVKKLPEVDAVVALFLHRVRHRTGNHLFAFLAGVDVDGVRLDLIVERL